MAETVSEPKEVPDRRKCSAKRTNGEPCGNYPMHGGKVCRKHGGAAKQVREKAKQRLLDLVHPALAELSTVLKNTDASDSNKIRAINLILDRALGPVAQQFQIDMQSELTVWGTGSFEGVAWVQGETEGEESEAIEANPHAETQLQIEAGQADKQPLEGRVVYHPPDDADPDADWSRTRSEDDPWAPAATAKTTERARVAAYEAELRERQKPLRSRRR